MNKRSSQVNFGFRYVDKNKKIDMVQQVFNATSEKYDLMNDILSLGIHRFWKNFTINYSGVQKGQVFLDLAGGTGDLTIPLSRLVGKTGYVILTDINSAMLEIGRSKIRNAGIIDNVEYVQANAENLPFSENTFDCIIMSFGLRNVTSKEECLKSIYSKLKVGGRVLILEFSKPTSNIIRKIYGYYLSYALPFLGKIISKNEESYRYLSESIVLHPDQEALKILIKNAGFKNVEYYNLTGGIVALHRAYKF